jgi:hypothetical protein
MRYGNSYESFADVTVSNAGREIATKLNPYLGTTREIAGIASLIHRQAVTYCRIQEIWCSVELSDSQTEYWQTRELAIESRITALVDSLPWVNGVQITVQFDGDPRGWTTRLIMPDMREIGIG